MKKIKAFLVVMMFCVSMMNMSVFAETLSEDGLEVSLTTDKESYSKGEVIDVTLTAVNTNNASVENVSLKSLVPSGYKLVEGFGDIKNVDVLESGDKVYLNVSIVSDESGDVSVNPNKDVNDGTKEDSQSEKKDGAVNESPKTGDMGKELVWLMILVIATGCVISMFVIKKTYIKKLLSLVLCVSMLGSLVSGFSNVSYADEVGTVSLEVSKTIVVDGVEMELNGIVKFDEVSTTEPSDSEDDYLINLSSSKTEFSLADDGTIYFYAQANVDVDSVSLVDSETKEVLLELVDDGLYSESGDDLPGDNIYTAKVELDTSYENTYEFYVAASGEENYISNSLKVIVVSKFTDEQLEDMETVDETIQSEIFGLDTFASMTVEERKEITDAVLEKMASEGLIKGDSVLYSEETESYTFLYSAGVLGSIIIREWNDKVNGTTNNITDLVVNNEEIINNAVTYSDDTEKVEIGKALILWSFNQAWDQESYRKPFYSQTETDWEALGLDTTVNYETTVEDYKKLKGYDVIIFSGHGTYDTYKAGIFGLKKTTVSSLLLHERATWEKNFSYSADLKAFRIGKASVQGGTMYAILPNFFEYYYDSDDLDGSFVFAENCELYGKDGVVRYKMADSLINTSVESVIGFHNSVMADYSRDLMKDYVENLCKGSTTMEAFEEAVSVNGSDDYFTGREQYGPTAYPIFEGNEESRLINLGIKNGDFEIASTPVEWNQVGDTRVISKLGSLTPTKNKQMAILTTGIGSAEKDYLSGTEGSVLSQMVKISEDKTTLVFDYDYVSEEPMEYVGSIYDDTFAVQIVSESGTETILLDKINTATWYAIDGINFDDGDDTTYHTGWKQIECDISKYAGQVVNIRFMVYDVGDSIYDSAVLLDAVNLK